MMVSGLSNLRQSEQKRRASELRWKDLGTWGLKNGLRWEVHVSPVFVPGSGLYAYAVTMTHGNHIGEEEGP